MKSYLIVHPNYFAGPLLQTNVNGQDITYQLEVPSLDKEVIQAEVTFTLLTRFEILLQEIKSIDPNSPLKYISQDLRNFIQAKFPQAITIKDAQLIPAILEDYILGINLGKITAIVSNNSTPRLSATLTMKSFRRFVPNSLVKVTGLQNHPEMNGSFWYVNAEFQFSGNTNVKKGSQTKTFKTKNLEEIQCYCGLCILGDYIQCSPNCTKAIHPECKKALMKYSHRCTCGIKYETVDLHFSGKIRKEQLYHYQLLRASKILQVFIRAGILRVDGNFRRQTNEIPDQLIWNTLGVKIALQKKVVDIEIISDSDCILLPVIQDNQPQSGEDMDE